MKNLKRFVAMFMLLAIVFTMVPVQAFATQDGTQSSMDMGDVSIQGTNGFGTLLSQEIDQSQAEADAEAEEYEPGYSVTDLVIEDRTAFVTYASMEDAMLVVALYTEDGMQMLTSATTQVTAEDTEAVLEFGDDMPEYFEASAYLLDTYDYSPLCASYDTPMYTREMQELLESTVDDYDPELVLNLDDDKTTNFAVYAESTILIEGDGQTNTVASIDAENGIYVVNNADDQIKDLSEGDVFVYPYEEGEILIVKVAEIEISGNTATITGGELEIEEAFAAVKVEGQDTTDNMMVDESTMDEGVVYEGLIDNGATYAMARRAQEGGTEVSKSAAFKIEKNIAEKGAVTVKVSGSLSFSAKLELSYYVSTTKQYIDFRITSEIKGNFTVTGKVEHAWSLCEAAFYPVPGIDIAIKPTFKIEVSGKIEFYACVKNSIGFTYDTINGFNSHNGKPDYDVDAKVQVTVFIGLDLKPQVEIAEGWIADFELEMPIGLECKITGTGHGLTTRKDDDLSWHECSDCLDLEPAFKAELKAKLQFIKCTWLKYEKDLLSITVRLGHLYISLDRSEMGVGLCPYQTFRVTFKVEDSSGAPVSDASIHLTAETVLGKTDEQGVLILYLPESTYIFSALVADQTVTRKTTVSNACLVTLKEGEIYDDESYSDHLQNLLGSVDAFDYGSVTAAGNCGASGSDVSWVLYGSGLLLISGQGDMSYHYTSDYSVPWYSYRNRITAVQIQDGVTSISPRAFTGCKLSGISIPDSVTDIGERAFNNCTLPSITIPNGVTSIENWTFFNCNGLSHITIPDSVTSIGKRAFGGCSITSITIPDSVTTIDEYAFYNCNLASVTLPNSITTIREFTFSACDNLTSVTIPDSVFSIANDAFSECDNLSSVTIPDSVKVIGNDAFDSCRSLSTFIIPNSVTRIGDSIFHACENLSNITIGSGITSISASTFYLCKNLTHVTIPDNVTTIGNSAFSFSGLTSITIPDSVTSIGNGAFSSCLNLTSVQLPSSVTKINEGTFLSCTQLSRIMIPNSVTSISKNAFKYCSNLTDVYFTGTQGEWASISIGVDNSPLINATIHYNCVAPTTMDQPAQLPTANQETEITPPTVNAVYPGEYGTEEKENYTLKTASFKDLVPAQQYVLLAMKSIEVDDPLAADNLLYVKQAAALEDGTLYFSYVQRETADISYVVACGASNRDLKDAEITFPEMTADGTLQVIDPTVVYDGKTLTEGIDYTIVGTVDYTDGGTYSCSIRGIRNYTGLVECTYTVAGLDLKPDAPSLTLATISSSGKIKLSWNAVEDAAKYEVYRCESRDGDYALLTTTTKTSVSNTSITVGKTYYYYVVAVTEDGTKSDPSTIKSKTCILPRTTVTLSNVASTGKIKVSWTAVTGATKYTVYIYNADGDLLKTSSTTKTSLTHSTATAGVAYTYKVRAHGSVTAATSAYSLPQTLTCDLAQPTVTLSNVASTGKIKITWAKVDGAVKYEVWRATSKNGTYSRLTTTTATSVTNTKTEAGKTYYYKVKALAQDSEANSAYSTAVSRTCDLAQPVVTIALSSKKPKVSWKKIDGATKYEVYRATSKNGTYSKVKTTTSTSYKDTAAKSGKTYYYKVVAVCKSTAGNSAYSAVKSIKSK